MGVTQYIGARYVPLFANPAEWTKTRTYEPLTIVLHEGNSFTSRQFVPVGIELDNDEFWLETGNYNAQIEAYRHEVIDYSQQVNNFIDNFTVENENQITIAPHLFGTLPPQTSLKTLAGGCFVSQGIICQYMKDADADPGELQVINAMTGNFIKKNTINLFHCNSLTYNPTTNELIAAAGAGKQEVYVIDYDTLTIKRTIEVDTYYYGITYNKMLNRYFACTRVTPAGFYMYELNPDFSVRKEKHYTENFGNSSVNIGSFGKYLAIVTIMNSRILLFDPETLEVVRSVPFSHNADNTYYLDEYEWLDSNESGSEIYYGAIVGIGVNCLGFVNSKLQIPGGNPNYNEHYDMQCNINTDNAYMYKRNGSTDAPFATIIEGYAFARLAPERKVTIAIRKYEQIVPGYIETLSIRNRQGYLLITARNIETVTLQNIILLNSRNVTLNNVHPNTINMTTSELALWNWSGNLVVKGDNQCKLGMLSSTYEKGYTIGDLHEYAGEIYCDSTAVFSNLIFSEAPVNNYVNASSIKNAFNQITAFSEYDTTQQAVYYIPVECANVLLQVNAYVNTSANPVSVTIPVYKGSNTTVPIIDSNGVVHYFKVDITSTKSSTYKTVTVKVSSKNANNETDNVRFINARFTWI